MNQELDSYNLYVWFSCITQCLAPIGNYARLNQFEEVSPDQYLSFSLEIWPRIYLYAGMYKMFSFFQLVKWDFLMNNIFYVGNIW